MKLFSKKSIIFYSVLGAITAFIIAPLIRSFLDYSNIGVSQFTNVDDFFSNDKVIILQEIKYQSKIKSFLNDFFILSLSPLIFLPFFVFFKKKN